MDLRYNEGRRLSVVDELASFINGLHKNKVFKKFYDNRYSNYNDTYYLDEYDESLALNKVIILPSS